MRPPLHRGAGPIAKARTWLPMRAKSRIWGAEGPLPGGSTAAAAVDATHLHMLGRFACLAAPLRPLLAGQAHAGSAEPRAEVGLGPADQFVLVALRLILGLCSHRRGGRERQNNEQSLAHNHPFVNSSEPRGSSRSSQARQAARFD